MEVKNKKTIRIAVSQALGGGRNPTTIGGIERSRTKGAKWGQRCRVGVEKGRVQLPRSVGGHKNGGEGELTYLSAM